MNRNLFSCVRFFDTECVACLHLGNETGKFVFATDCKYAVCFDEKRMEKVFRRFCGFIIMFKSCEIFELNKFAYVIEICYASSFILFSVKITSPCGLTSFKIVNIVT